MALQPDAMVNLVQTTLAKYEKNRMTDLALTLQDYIIMPRIFRGKKNRIKEVSGTKINWKVRTSHQGQAQTHGLYATINVDVTDRMTEAEAPWRSVVVPAAVDTGELNANLGNEERLLDHMAEIESSADAAFIEKMEQIFLSKPADSSDTENPYGFFYWLTYSATEGFNGGNPAGYPGGKGGLSFATHDQWANYTNQYTNFTAADAVKKIRIAFRQCNFKNPVSVPSLGGEGMNMVDVYTNQDVLEGFYTFLESRNDNLGIDATGIKGSGDEVLVNKRPLIWVPYLDTFASDPIMGVNWKDIYMYVLKGTKFENLPPKRGDKQPFVITWYTGITCNLVFKNLRSSFLLAKSDPVNDL